MTIELKSGEISPHPIRLVHGSPANTSDDGRVGDAMNPAFVKLDYECNAQIRHRGADVKTCNDAAPLPERAT